MDNNNDRYGMGNTKKMLDTLDSHSEVIWKQLGETEILKDRE